MRRALLPGLIGLGILALMVWAFLPRPVPVETAQVAMRPLAVELEEEGQARIREVFSVSAPIAGRLQRVTLRPGDPVAAGDSVARIGPAAPALLDARARAVAEASVAAALAAVDLARAQVLQAEAARSHAATEADRARALHDRAVISERVLETALLALRTAETAQASAEATLAVRQRELESARAVLAGGDPSQDAACCVPVLTPVSGRVLRVVTEDETVVQTGTPILEVGDPADMEITVDLLSRDAVRVAPGAAATITGWGGPALPARVERIEPAAVTRVSALGVEERRVGVVLALTGDAADRQALGHGYRVLVRIRVWETDQTLTLPVGALFRDGADWAAFAVDQGRARLRRIELGERNDSFAQVRSGLTAGDAVILHPGDTIADGTQVRPLAP